MGQGYVLQRAIEAVEALLTGPGGIRVQVEQLADADPVTAHAISSFVVRSFPLKRGVVADEEFTCDPRIRIQVEKLVNAKSQKFMPFSGHCQVLLTVEATDDRQDLVAAELNAICDAILLVLDNHSGAWAPGICFGGGYELSIAPMDRGAQGFQQIAQVRFQLSIDDGGAR